MFTKYLIVVERKQSKLITLLFLFLLKLLTSAKENHDSSTSFVRAIIDHSHEGNTDKKL